MPILEDWLNVLEQLLSFDLYLYVNKETALIKRRNKMENILVVIRDEIRENRKVLKEIRDILKEMSPRSVIKEAAASVEKYAKDKTR